MVADDGSARHKAALRARLLAARRARAAGEIALARAAIASAALERAREVGCAAAYEPMRTEPGSIELLDGLQQAGCRVLVPVLLESRDLDWREWGGPATQPGAEALGVEAIGVEALGVEAIGAAGLVFVPALAVDGRGQRLGRGGGSYDRALARVRPGVPVVALVYDDEVLDEVPVDPWDRPVTGALTPAGGWHWF